MILIVSCSLLGGTPADGLPDAEQILRRAREAALKPRDASPLPIEVDCLTLFEIARVQAAADDLEGALATLDQVGDQAELEAVQLKLVAAISAARAARPTAAADLRRAVRKAEVLIEYGTRSQYGYDPKRRGLIPHQEVYLLSLIAMAEILAGDEAAAWEARDRAVRSIGRIQEGDGSSRFEFLTMSVGPWASSGDIRGAYWLLEAVPVKARPDDHLLKEGAHFGIAVQQARFGDLDGGLAVIDRLQEDDSRVRARIRIAKYQAAAGELAKARETLGGPSEQPC